MLWLWWWLSARLGWSVHLVRADVAGRIAVGCGVGVAVGVAARGVAVGVADSGSTKVAEAVLYPGTVPPA
jgi:hypothetical protein